MIGAERKGCIQDLNRSSEGSEPENYWWLGAIWPNKKKAHIQQQHELMAVEGVQVWQVKI